MIRILLIVFAGGLIVAVAALAGAAGMGRLDWTLGDHAQAGPQVTRDMGWSGSETLRTNVRAEIDYRQGPTPKLTVSGPKPLIDALVLNGDTLSAPDRKGIHWDFDDQPKVTITVAGPRTHQFVLTGAQKLTIEDFDQDSLDIEVSGASRAEVAGRARRVALQVSGAGDIDLSNLAVDDAVLHISGAGKVSAAPKVSADVHISGAGKVDLLTKPATLTTQISGAGSVTQP